jgi:hypothetical protein
MFLWPFSDDSDNDAISFLNLMNRDTWHVKCHHASNVRGSFEVEFTLQFRACHVSNILHKKPNLKGINLLLLLDLTICLQATLEGL